MGGVGEFLTGSSEDAKQVGTAETLLPGQKTLLNQLTSLLGTQLDEGAPAYTGQLTAGASPLQQSAFDVVGDIIGSSAVGAGQEALTGMLQPFDPTSTTDFFNKAVKAPTLQMFEEDILPSVQERFIGQGIGRSGAAQAALSKAGSDVTSGLSEQLAKLLYSGEQAHLGRQLPAAQQSFQQTLGGLQLGLGAGGQQRNIESQLLGGEYNEFLRTLPSANPYLNLLPTALGTKAFEPIIQGPTQQEGFLPTLMETGAQIFPFL